MAAATSTAPLDTSPPLLPLFPGSAPSSASGSDGGPAPRTTDDDGGDKDDAVDDDDDTAAAHGDRGPPSASGNGGDWDDSAAISAHAALLASLGALPGAARNGMRSPTEIPPLPPA